MGWQSGGAVIVTHGGRIEPVGCHIGSVGTERAEREIVNRVLDNLDVAHVKIYTDFEDSQKHRHRISFMTSTMGLSSGFHENVTGLLMPWPRFTRHNQQHQSTDTM